MGRMYQTNAPTFDMAMRQLLEQFRKENPGINKYSGVYGDGAKFTIAFPKPKAPKKPKVR